MSFCGFNRRSINLALYSFLYYEHSRFTSKRYRSSSRSPTSSMATASAGSVTIGFSAFGFRQIMTFYLGIDTKLNHFRVYHHEFQLDGCFLYNKEVMIAFRLTDRLTYLARSTDCNRCGVLQRSNMNTSFVIVLHRHRQLTLNRSAWSDNRYRYVWDLLVIPRYDRSFPGIGAIIRICKRINSRRYHSKFDLRNTDAASGTIS